jgi:hypothetical protein
MGSINKLIIEEARKEKKFMCEDIRLLNDKNNEKIKSNFALISSNVENKLKPIKSDNVELVVQELKNSERRTAKKVKFDLDKNIIQIINKNEIVKLVQLENNESIKKSSLKKNNSTADEEIIGEINDEEINDEEIIQNIIEEKIAISNVIESIISKIEIEQETQCHKCKFYGHKKNVCPIPPGIKQKDINSAKKINNIRAKMVCHFCNKVGHLKYRCPNNQNY